MISSLIGGIGLFLLGMILLTDGLKAAAGKALRRLLRRFSGGTLKGVASGAVITTMVQSSSATTLAVIGFVSAGLIGFRESIGLICGAAIGTTSTGWLVSVLGLKMSISAFALPLVGVGALLRLLTKDRSASIGQALAGFGLIFVGISTLQAGMEDLSGSIDLAGLPYATFTGRLLLLLIGATMTVVMQSSSAAVATTLTALFAGAITTEQAAVLVIGQNMGTAVTAALASIGASVPAKRTALSHVLFNGFSGTVAFVCLPLFMVGIEPLVAAFGPATAIAAFHTAFNVLAAALLLPFVSRYAALITWILPDRGPMLTRHLDPSVSSVPAVATEAARRTVLGTAAVLIELTAQSLRGTQSLRRQIHLQAARDALRETRRFLSGVRSPAQATVEHSRLSEVLHAIDHLDRLEEALKEEKHPRVLAGDDNMRDLASSASESMFQLLESLQETPSDEGVKAAELLSLSLADKRRVERPGVMARTAAGELDPDTALEQLDAMRWVDRLAYHVWRASLHLTTDDDKKVGSENEVYSTG